MEVSITAVTDNRLFSKALFRVTNDLEELENIANDIDCRNEKFEILQLVFEDEKEGCSEAIGCKKGGRIFQVRVDIPNNFDFKPGNDNKLVDEIYDRFKRSLVVCNLSEEKKSIVLERVDKIALLEATQSNESNQPL